MHIRWLTSVALFIFLFLLTTPSQALAQDTGQNLTISDAIYADLAVQGNLDNVSLYYRDKNSTDDVSYRDNKAWIPASTCKLYVAMYAYDQIAKGKASLADVITIKTTNVVPSEDVENGLPPLIEGDQALIQRLIEQMLTQSDNTAYNTLLDVFDRREITKYVRILGLSSSSIGSKLNQDEFQSQSESTIPGYGINTTTAADYGKAFELINDKKIPGAQQLFDILKQQRLNNMLPLYLPKNIIVAHKTGDLDPLYHDGGIIEATSGAYILSIFSNAGTPNLVAHLSELIYSKNYDLVGKEILSYKINIKGENDQKEPTLAQEFQNQRVIGESTASLKAPAITAADLGITAADLSLKLDQNQLPNVLIPKDSFLHSLVQSYFQIKKVLAIGNDTKTKVQIEELNLQLAEAQNLKKRGKTQDSQNLIANIQPQLSSIVKQKSIANTEIQTAVKSVSETRFSLLAEDLKEAKGQDRLKLIKKIGTEAKETATTIQPQISKANTASSLNQRPLIGEVISSNNNSVSIKTASGQQVEIPKSDTNVKVRSKNTEEAVNDLSQVKPGTTIAMVGTTSEKGDFKPSFILSNIPRQLSAPQPATVLQVNPESNSMFISENGNPVRVQITQDTSIKGSDTDVALKSIKTGDQVVVHGNPVPPPQPQNESTPQAAPSTSPTPISSQTSPAPKNDSQKVTVSPTPKTGIQKGTGSPLPSSGASVKPQTSTQKPQPASQTGNSPKPPSPAPQVIKSTSIQVIEKDKNVGKNPTPNNSSSNPQKSENKNPPPPPPATTNSNSSQKDTSKDDKKSTK